MSRDNWQTVRFGDVARNVKVIVDPNTSGLERYIAGEHMTTDDLRLRQWGTVGDGYLGPAFHMKFTAGQILYGSRRTYLRKVALADFDGICSNTTFVIEAIPERILPDLLPFVMQSEPFTQYSILRSRGSTNPYVTWSDIASYEFPLPPLDEQRRIADILWAAEYVLENWERVRDDLLILKQTQMRYFFDLRYDKYVQLDRVGAWISGGTPSRARADFWNGDVYWASPKDMKVDVLHETSETITPEAARIGSRIVPENTIFIVIRGMILAHTFPVAISGRSMAFNQDLKALIVSSDYVPRFMFYWLQSNAKKILSLTSESSHGTKRLPSDELFKLQAPCVPIGEQERVVQTLDLLTDQIAQVENHLSHSKRLKLAFLNEEV